MIGALFAHSGFSVWLIDTLVASSLLLLLVLFIRRPVARMFGPHVAYALWLIPAARMLLPPVPAWIFPFASGADAAARIAPYAQHIGDGSAPIWDGSVAGIAPALFTVPVTALPGWVGGVLLALWGLGAMACLGWQWAVHRRLLALLDDADLTERVGGIRVFTSDAVSGPVSFGLIDRVIVLPGPGSLPLSAAERELALAHERAHHARGDLWANGLGVLFAAAHWFNPLARHAWRAFRFDQEAACDATVLGHADKGSRAIYARVLAKAATGHPSAFASPMVARDKLKDRLVMLSHPNPTPARRRAGTALAIAGAIAALAATATPVLADPADSEAATDAQSAQTQAAAARNDEAAAAQTAVEAARAAALEARRAALTAARQAQRDARVAMRQAETARRDGENARRDAEAARRDAEAMASRHSEIRERARRAHDATVTARISATQARAIHARAQAQAAEAIRTHRETLAMAHAARPVVAMRVAASCGANGDIVRIIRRSEADEQPDAIVVHQTICSAEDVPPAVRIDALRSARVALTSDRMRERIGDERVEKIREQIDSAIAELSAQTQD